MSDTEPVSPVQEDKKVPAHPKVSVMVDTAIKTLAEPKGSSLHAINKYINANYGVDVQKLSTYIKKYLKTAVESGDLIQPKGKGASGSFKFNKKKVEVKKKTPKVKPPKPLKMQTSTPKKTLKPKKAATKSPNKSPVKKMKLVDGEEVPLSSTFTKPKTKIAKTGKVSLPTKPRKSLIVQSKRAKKPKKSITKKGKGPKVEVSPGGKSENSITSPKPTKTKSAAKSTKAKKSPKPAASNLKKIVSKKTPTKGKK